MKRKISILITAALLFAVPWGCAYAEEYIAPVAEFVVQPEGWTIVDGMENGALLYTDNRNASYTIDDEDVYGFEGATLIQTRLADTFAYTNDPGYNVKSDQVQATIRVNHSCDIYIISKVNTGMAAGGMDYLRWLGMESYGYEPLLNESGDYKYLSVKNFGGNANNHYIYKKSLTVPEGETDTFDVGYVGKWCENYMYSVVVVWSGEDE